MDVITNESHLKFYNFSPKTYDKFQDQLHSEDDYLSNDTVERRYNNAEKSDEIQFHLEAEFLKKGLVPIKDCYEIDGKSCSNIEIEFLGTTLPDEIIVIGAHYDTTKDAPGANDNASGVAALVTLAQLLRVEELKRTVRLVALANDNQSSNHTDFMGSYAYASRCKERGDRVVAMISLETISYLPDKDPSLHFMCNAESKDLTKRLAKLFKKNSGLDIKIPPKEADIPEMDTSHYWSFWKHGFKNLMVTDGAWINYPFYHSKDDTADKLDYDVLAKIVSGLRKTVIELADENV